MSSLHFSPWLSQSRLLPATRITITIITSITIITTASEIGPLTGAFFTLRRWQWPGSEEALTETLRRRM
jgi:hypothetical protein